MAENDATGHEPRAPEPEERSGEITLVRGSFITYLLAKEYAFRGLSDRERRNVEALTSPLGVAILIGALFTPLAGLCRSPLSLGWGARGFAVGSTEGAAAARLRRHVQMLHRHRDTLTRERNTARIIDMPAMDSQLTLPLHRAGRGGRRPGAGRKPGPNPRIPHLRRSTFSRCTPCHVTLRARQGVPSLRSARLVRELERSFAQACEREEFRVAHYSIQRDHVHLIVEAESPAALGRGMKSIAARLARAANRIFRRRGPVLADRYHHRLLRTPREVRHAIAYVLHNARKHAVQLGRTLAVRAGIDPASSGRWFAGWTQALPAPDGRPPVSRPRSWLLRVGWLCHGRIAPDEIPGGRGAVRTPR